MKNLLIFIGLALSPLFAMASSSLSATDSQHCKAVRGQTEPFILALKKGEKVQEAITRCANDAELNGATISGIGAFQPVTLRFFDKKIKEYRDRTINDFVEVTSFIGNITFVDGKRQNHIHVTVADENFKPYAGHLNDARVGGVLEIQITPLSKPVYKRFDKNVGLNVIVS